MQYVMQSQKMTQWSLFVSKEMIQYHNKKKKKTQQKTKSIPWPVMLKKLKLNGSMKA